MTEIFGLDITELTEVVRQLGMPTFRAKQIFQWLYEKSVFNFALMLNLSKADRDLLIASCKVLPLQLEILQTLCSADGLTEKLLIKLTDGATIETVLMHHDYGYSVCVSTQVGCAMGCKFCASGLKGCQRSLTKAEILAQVYLCNLRLKDEGQRVSRVVVMGSGEPMLNFEAVFGALEFLHDSRGANMSYRNMTVSTCGIVGGIEKMRELNHPVNLAVSLHSVRTEVRDELMPVNRHYPFIQVLVAAENYALSSGRNVTYEYILIKGKNDSVSDALLLADFLKFKHASVNLIPANYVAEKGWEKSQDSVVNKFLQVLNRGHINVTVRREMGADIGAACGQLRNSFVGES